MPFVLDSSVALAWVLPDELDTGADELCDRLTHDTALVPTIWPLEIGNVLLVAMRRGRLERQDLARLVKELRALPVKVEMDSLDHTLSAVLDMADHCGLTTYDAAYVELASRRQLPLATLDSQLRRACTSLGIDVLP